MVTFPLIHRSFATSAGLSVLYTVGWWTHSVFSIAHTIFKQENPELLASFRDTFWRALSLCPRTLVSNIFIHDSMGSPYIGCLLLQYLLSNPRNRVEQLGSC
ncbi:hypothetical protein M405DRAFT_98521 [Rhizopogon salebrosus TDB-379]|nr:hypothetical protein M405DRAFT_98521 [Rhizopogon salebrosus TDB-379]